MATVHTVGWGLAGAATTMLARRAMRRAMHEPGGQPRLPRAAKHGDSFGLMVVLAAAAGALLAVGDVFDEQRRRVAQS